MCILAIGVLGSIDIPFGVKLWRVEILVDLANYHNFAQVSSAKIPCLILNNIINVQICQSSCHQMCFVANSPKFSPTKVSLYSTIQNRNITVIPVHAD